MREIKFRAWDKATKQFVTSFTMTSNGYIELWIGDGSSKVREPQDFEVMQYTGLKDWNGTEIYDGDILRESGVRQDGSPWECIYEVSWGKCGYSDAGFGWQIDPDEVGEAEVVGNIYENPGLLTPTTN